jgi:SulP family sulfate permease
LIGFGISTLIFMAQMSDLHVSRQPVDVDRMSAAGHNFVHPEHPISIYYISGPLFFAAARKLVETVEALDQPEYSLILSLRGVPLVDATGIEVLREIWHRQHKAEGNLLLAAVQPRVEALLERTGVMDEIGKERLFWSADRAILSGRIPATEGAARAPEKRRMTAWTPRGGDHAARTQRKTTSAAIQ